MDQALQKISKFFNKYATQVYLKVFERIQEMPGATRIFKRIASTPDKDQLKDYLAEALYALIFADLGFQVEIEPFGSKGPDLRISRDSHQAVVEIMRFRKIHPGPPILDFSDGITTLPEYGDPPRDIRKAFGKIQKKFSQAGDGESIIAIWNDDEELEELEVETAVADLRDDAAHHILSLPDGLLFILYGSNAVYPGNKQLYCFPLRHRYQPHQATWQKELASFTVNELIQRILA